MTRVRDGLTSAVLTPAGRGAVATVSVHGPAGWDTGKIDQHFVAANGRPLAQQVTGRICFGHWTSIPGKAEPAESTDFEEVVLSRLEDGTVEICCHGGPIAVHRILDDLLKQGIPTIPWQDHIPGSRLTLKAELDAVLVRASTRRTALKLLELQTTLPIEFARLRQLASNAMSDSANAEPTFATTLSSGISRILSWAPLGIHLTKPWRIVLAGRPNVGKSTLMNALAGFDRAIVYDEPGTTRDVVSVQTALHGWPVQLLDTAGIREATNEIEREGVTRSRQALEKADCVCLLLDSSETLTEEDRQLMSEVAASATPSVLVVTKSDLECRWNSTIDEAVPVSAATSLGVDHLIEVVVETVIPEPAADAVMPVSARQVSLLAAAKKAVDEGAIEVAVEQLEELSFTSNQ